MLVDELRLSEGVRTSEDGAASSPEGTGRLTSANRMLTLPMLGFLAIFDSEFDCTTKRSAMLVQ